MYTLIVLVRNLESPDPELRFETFQLRQIRQGNQRGLVEAQKTLRTEDVGYGDWILTGEYENLPPGPGPSGFGRIPMDAEDTLLLLRLFRPGDLSFARLAIREPNGHTAIQNPYRV